MLLTMDSDSLESSANFKFCKDLLNWVFQESGVLRASNLRHNKKNERCTESDQSLCSANPENYHVPRWDNGSEMTQAEIVDFRMQFFPKAW